MASTPNAIPSGASAAVLKASEPVPEAAIAVEGPNFDEPISLQQLLENYKRIGFQASSLAKAIDIVNKMVCFYLHAPYVGDVIECLAQMAAFRRPRRQRRIGRIHISRSQG